MVDDFSFEDDFSFDDGPALSQADFDTMAQSDNVDFDAYASQFDPVGIAQIITEPTVTSPGARGRTNITNVGAGSNLVFDPTFAAALDITRGIDPTRNIGGSGGLTVPSYLRPQIEGEFMTTPLGEADMVRPMFNSQLERILQQTIPEAMKEGPVARIATGIGNFFGNIFSEGRDFAKDATAGIKLPSLKDISEGFTNFMDRFRPRETDTRAVNMTEAAIRDEVPRFNYGEIPSGFTFGSMPRNTGIVSVDPRAAQNANRNVAEAIKDLQLVPSEDSRIIGNRNASINMRQQAGENLSDIVKSFQSPISKVQITDPAGVSSALPTERDREKRDFARDIFEAFPDQRTRQFGPKERLASINEEYFNRLRNQESFVDSGNFIVLD